MIVCFILSTWEKSRTNGRIQIWGRAVSWKSCKIKCKKYLCIYNATTPTPLALSAVHMDLERMCEKPASQSQRFRMQKVSRTRLLSWFLRTLGICAEAVQRDGFTLPAAVFGQGAPRHHALRLNVVHTHQRRLFRLIGSSYFVSLFLVFSNNSSKSRWRLLLQNQKYNEIFRHFLKIMKQM